MIPDVEIGIGLPVRPREAERDFAEATGELRPRPFQIQMREARNWGLIPSGEGKKEWRHGHRLQAELVREGIAAGVFYDGDPELMAATAIAVMQVQLAGLLERPGDPDPEVITTELVQQILRCLGRFDLPDYGTGAEAASQTK